MTIFSTGVISAACKENNLVSSKAGALIVLKSLLSRPIDVDLIAETDGSIDAFETIVEAETVRAAGKIEVEADD